MVRTPLAALIAAAVLAAGPPALAADPVAPDPVADAPVATAAGATPPPASVADQIDAYLKSSPALALPRDGADGVVPAEAPRKVHGVASVSIGTGGYRSAYVRTDLPVGKTGTVTIALQDTDFGRRGGYYGGYGSGYGGHRPGYGGYGGYGAHRSIGLGFNFDASREDRPECRTTWNGGRPTGFTAPIPDDEGCRRLDD